MNLLGEWIRPKDLGQCSPGGGVSTRSGRTVFPITSLLLLPPHPTIPLPPSLPLPQLGDLGLRMIPTPASSPPLKTISNRSVGSRWSYYFSVNACISKAFIEIQKQGSDDDQNLTEIKIQKIERRSRPRLASWRRPRPVRKPRLNFDGWRKVIAIRTECRNLHTARRKLTSMRFSTFHQYKICC
jgi:hypothetical protein